MAEHFDGSGETLRDKTLASSGEFNKFHPPVLDAGAGKSPGKTRKSKKGLLFKKSSSQEEFTRSSGRGKKKSGKEKKLDHGREHGDETQQAGAPTSPPLQHQLAEDGPQYDINAQEVEQKSTLEVSVKRLQKANKELLRHNIHLAKLVDNLKKEKELLVSERVKLKSENKSLEKELKKVPKDHRLTKRMSQPLLDDDGDALREKVQALEEQLMERERITSLLKLRLDRSQVAETSERSSEPEEIEKSSNSVLMKNGYVLDSSIALEMVLEEHDTSLRLKRENEELKSRLTSMEAGAAEGFRVQRDLVNSSPKSPRKRSSGFFKRGKKNTSSGTLKHEEAQQVRADLVQSQSPEVLVMSDSHHEQLDVSLSPLHSQKESSISLPNYNASSPNLSPHMPSKNRAHAEVVTLQSCLRIALEEKNDCNECLALLEKELDGTKSKTMELEDTIATAAEKSNVEIEQLKSNLKAAKLEKDTFCGELNIVQQEVNELVDKNEDMDRMYTVSLSKKNKRIQELEQQLQIVALQKVTSPPYIKPPAYGFSAASKKQVNVSPTREKVLSPPHQSKETGFGYLSSKLAEPSVSNIKQQENKLEKAREKQQDTKLEKAREKQQDTKLEKAREKQQDTKLEKAREKQQDTKLEKAREKQQDTKPDCIKQDTTLEKAKEKQQEAKLEKASEKQRDSQLEKAREKQQDAKLEKASKKQGAKPEIASERQQGAKPEKANERQQGTKPSERQAAMPEKASERQQEVKFENIKERQETTSERVRAPSVDSTRHDQTEKNLLRERSPENILKVVPLSPSRRSVGRLLRESSIDRFENPPVKEVKKLISTSGIPSPSLVHSPKVAATRAMFEQKIDETKTDLSNVRKISRTSVGVEQRRRSSVSTASLVTGTKEAVQPHHSKSSSCDFSSKQTPIQKVSDQSTGNANWSKAAPPTPVMEQIDEPRAQSNEAKNSQHQQQEKPPHSGPVAAARKFKSSDSVAKVSRITITSVASPTSSPVLSTRKDIAVTPRRDQPSSSSSAMLVRHPTSPSLGTSHRVSPSPAVRSQIGQTSSTRVSTVSATVRHSPTTTIYEISQPTKSPVSKSLTESRIQPPMNRSSGFWSISNSSTTSTTTTTTTPASTTPTPSNRVVVKTSSRLGDNLLSSVNKAGSLQNISAQFSSENRVSPQNDSSSSTSASTSSSGVRRGPTHKAMQRRERKERPKTMYAGHAETANLVNLISRFQVEAEQLKTNGVSSQTPSSSVSALKMNGTSSSTTPAKSSSISSAPSSIPKTVPLRYSGTTKDRQARPTSYSNNISNSESSSGLNFQPPSSYGSSKPLPHERILQRSRTVAGGLGTAKQSKKAMLLKWCQIVTQEYENVNISNFAESFSNGLAFCAMMHHFLPDQIPFNTLNPSNRESNFKIAFQVAEGVGIPSLLDVEDMVSLPKPDWMSVMTYVSFIYNKFGQQQQKQSSMV